MAPAGDQAAFDGGGAQPLLLLDGGGAQPLLLLDDAGVKAAGADAPAPSRARWWVLIAFSWLNLLQCWFWVLPSFVSDAYNDVLGLDDDAVELLVNLGQIIFVVGALPYAVLLGRGRLRLSVVSTAALTTVAAAMRVAARDASPTSQALIYSATVLNSFAGVVSMGAVSALAEAWAPVAERATFVAIAAEANIVGGNLAFLVGPAMVPAGAPPSALAAYHWVCFAAAAPLLVAVVAYFPDGPPQPPTGSAALQRRAEEAFTLRAFVATLRALATSRPFWVIALAYGAVSGVFSSWQGVLSLLLGPSFDQATAGWLAFASSFVGSLAGVAMGRVLDRLPGWHKALGAGLFGAAAVCIAAFWALTTPGVVPPALAGSAGGLAALFTATTLAGVAVNASMPVFYELLVECTFPQPETAVLLLALTVSNLLGIPFLAFTPGSWMTGALAGVLACAAAAVAVGFRPTYGRYHYDLKGGGGGSYVESEDKGEGPLLELGGGASPLTAAAAGFDEDTAGPLLVER
jgi:hypothetical protein